MSRIDMDIHVVVEIRSPLVRFISRFCPGKSRDSRFVNSKLQSRLPIYIRRIVVTLNTGAECSLGREFQMWSDSSIMISQLIRAQQIPLLFSTRPATT